MNKVVTTPAPSVLVESFSFLQATRTPIKSWMGFKSDSLRRRTYELAALETYNGRNVMTTLVPSFFNGSSSFLQVTRSTIKAWMVLNFGKIPSLTSELAALERLKNQ